MFDWLLNWLDIPTHAERREAHRAAAAAHRSLVEASSRRLTTWDEMFRNPPAVRGDEFTKTLMALDRRPSWGEIFSAPWPAKTVSPYCSFCGLHERETTGTTCAGCGAPAPRSVT